MKRKVILGVCTCMTLSSILFAQAFVYATDEELKEASQVGDVVEDKELEQPLINEEEPPVVNEENEDKKIEEKVTSDKELIKEKNYNLKTNVIWDGTSDTTWFTNNKSVYEISTPEQLAGLASLVNSGNPMTDITFKLMNDIYLNENATPKNQQWPMIGNNTAHTFKGMVDGQNHTIYNVYVNETTYDYAGFLGQTAHSTPLKNIVITGSITGKNQAGVIGHVNDNVTLENITNKAEIIGVQPGGIVPEGDTLVLKNCVNEGTITGSGDRTGGLLGYSYRKTTMLNCHNKGNVTGKGRTGGLVGYASTISIDNSSNTGNITGNGYQVGGLAGETTGSSVSILISNSSNSGNIYGYGEAGGLVGKNCGSIINSHNLAGKVETYFYQVGGLVGYQISAGTDASYYGEIINCTNKASVTAAIGSNVEEQYSRYAGGLIGSCAKVGKIDKCINYGTIKGKSYVGGLVGTMFQEAYQGISHSQNKGIVEGVSYVGGLIGYNTAKISIESSSNNANITGNGYDVGGLVGYNIGGTIADSTSLGNLYGWGSVGGIVGTNEALIKDCKNLGGKIETYFSNAGGIVGYQTNSKIDVNDNGEILNCSNKANVQAGIGNDSSNATGAGGIVGGLNLMKSVSGCSNTGKIKGYDSVGGIIGVTNNITTGMISSNINEGNVDGMRWIAGIVGTNNGATTILKCTNKANLTMMRNDAVIGKNMGGITSYSPLNSQIDQCVNEGDIVSFGNWTGGIVGSNYGVITNCKNTGDMKIEKVDKNNNTTYMQIGMIAGWSKGNLTNCINDGQLDVLLASEYARINGSEMNYNVGGIVGWIGEATVSQCYNNAKVTGTRESITQTRTQFYNFGGIAGYTNQAIVQYSHNKGVVRLQDTSSDNVTNQAYIGGIVSLSYNASQILESSNTGDLHTNIKVAHLGGIGGHVDDTDIHNSFAVCDLYADTNEVVFIAGVTVFYMTSNTNYTMENVYFAGDMILQNQANASSAYLAAIYGSGALPETIKNVFYDDDALTKNVAVMQGVRKLHTFEMTGNNISKNKTNLDFDHIWLMKEDCQDNGNRYRFYPTLRSHPDELDNTYIYYLVSIKEDPRYDIKIDQQFNQDGEVLPHDSYEFTLDIKDKYKSLKYKVFDNGNEITPTQNNLYQINDIQKDHNITVQFELMQPKVTFPKEITILYGQSLKDGKFEFEGEGTIEFVKPDKKLTVKESGSKHKMVFQPTDPLFYKTVEQDVIIHVLPIDPIKPKDIHLNYKKDLKLKDIELPTGWSWDDEEVLVFVGSHQYKVSYHDEDGNYRDMSHVDLTINMENENTSSDPNNPSKPDISIKPNEPSDTDSNEKVETGDKTLLPFYTLCILFSLGSFIGIRTYKTKKKK